MIMVYLIVACRSLFQFSYDCDNRYSPIVKLLIEQRRKIRFAVSITYSNGYLCSPNNDSKAIKVTLKGEVTMNIVNRSK